MKVAVALCLFACVAVSHAAFSGSLLQQAQPLVNQAMFKIRLATVSRSSEGSGLQTLVVSQLQEHIQTLLDQIQGGATAISEITEQVQAELTQALAHLQALGGSAVSGISEIVAGLSESLGSIWGSIGSWFGKSAGQKSIWGILGNLDFDSIVALLNQAVQGLSNPALIVHAAQAALEHLGLPDRVIEFIIGHLSNFITPSSRGFLDTLTGVWGHLSGVASGLLASLQDIAQSIMTTGGDSLDAIQLLAQNFVDHAQTAAAQITGQAAQQLLEFLEPYQHDLGALWTQVQTQVTQIVGTISTITN